MLSKDVQLLINSKLLLNFSSLFVLKTQNCVCLYLWLRWRSDQMLWPVNAEYKVNLKFFHHWIMWHNGSFNLPADKIPGYTVSSSIPTKYQRVVITNQEKKGFSSRAKRFPSHICLVGNLPYMYLLTIKKQVKSSVMICVYFRMKIQDQAATAVCLARKSKALPSQRKALQALLHPRSQNLLIIFTDFRSSTIVPLTEILILS